MKIAYLFLIPLFCGGCFFTPRVVLHPIEKSDIWAVDVGETCGKNQVVKQGWFLSDLYVNEVMNTKIK